MNRAMNRAASRATSRARTASTALLAGTLLSAGALHFAAAEHFDPIVPPVLPGTRRFYTLASGVAELAAGALVAVPRTRRLGARAAAALFVAVFPANVQMAWDWRRASAGRRAIAYGRLPLQPVLVAWALSAARARA